MTDSINWQPLLDAAERVALSAYAPYSKFHVGAAVLTEDGSVFAGCNVENASYGLTVCAERAAIFTAVAASPNRKIRIKAVAIVTDPPVPGSPCGACRQVMAEFGIDAVVSYVSASGRVERAVSELL